MRVELTDDPSCFIARDWTEVTVADPDGTFFHTPAYLKLWWEEFGSGALRVAVAESDGRPVGAAGVEIVDRQLRFLGGFDVTDYMGPVARPGFQEAMAKELLAALLADGGWDRADLRGLPVEGSWLGALEEAGRAVGLAVVRGDDGVAPCIDLPPSYQDYLAGLPRKLRHEIRRKERRLVEAAGSYSVHLSSPQTVQRDLDLFFELHRSSPGPKGKFMNAGMEIFFRRLAEAFLPGRRFHLAFLETGGRKVAGAIGFAFKDTFSLYNSSFDREFGAWSPGMVLVANLIQGAVELGCHRFDMLTGDLEYKYRFGARPRQIGRLELVR